MRAFVGVDLQNDFCEGGNLAVAGGAECAARVAEWLAVHHDEYALVVLTRDWHINPGTHFSTTPDFNESFPVHCVAGTPGAEFHPNLGLSAPSTEDDAERYLWAIESRPIAATVVSKGQFEATFSGFDGTTNHGVYLATLLRAHKITEVEIGGIATEFCDKATALDSVANGFRTTVFTDLMVGLDAVAIESAVAEMEAAGVRIRSTRG